MNIYTYSNTWFRHVIAAPSPLDAHYFVVQHLRNGTGGIVPIVELLSPDVLTRRAADEATATVEIDRIPLFNVERHGEFWHEIDHDAAGLLTRDERAELRKVSTLHLEWLDAYDDPKLYAGIIALEDPPRPEQTRALAAAFGCGPLPSWLAPIAPALIALENEAEARGFPAELDCALERDATDLRTWLGSLIKWAWTVNANSVARAAENVVRLLNLSMSDVDARWTVRNVMYYLGWL